MYRNNILENLYRSFNIPFAFVNPYYFRIKKDEFLDLIIPVGLINLDKDYNFIPKTITEKLNFKRYLQLASIMLTMLLVFNFYNLINLSANTLNNFFEIQNLLDENRFYEEKLSKNLLRNRNLDVIQTFFNLELKSTQNIQAINEISHLEKYLNLINGYKNLDFSFDNGKAVYSITFEKTFSSRTEMERFIEDLVKIKYINIKVEKDINNKKINVVLKYEKHFK